MVMSIDTRWFKEKIKASRYRTLRGVARRMQGRNGPMEMSSLFHMLKGTRQMKLVEARQLADLLEIPLIDVIRRAGVHVGPRDLKSQD